MKPSTDRSGAALELQLRAVEAPDLEWRLAKVEKQIAKDEAEALGKGRANCENEIPASRTGQNFEGQAELRRVAEIMASSSMNNSFRSLKQWVVDEAIDRRKRADTSVWAPLSSK